MDNDAIIKLKDYKRDVNVRENSKCQIRKVKSV